MKQKKTNHYLLGTVFCLLLLLLLTPGQATKVQAATDSGLIDVKLAEGIRRYDYAYEVLNLVNQERAKSNLQPVTMDKNLLECAMTRAQELTLYASHTRPNGTSCMTAFPYFGYNSSENLAINQVSPEDVMNSWMNSSGHRTNIMASGNVSIELGAKGESFGMVTACASSTHSIGEAYRLIKHGYQDAVIAGGAESTITPTGVAGFTNMKALSQSTDRLRASIPFDKERSGFVMGEGSAILILEDYEHAKQRGAKIYAEIAGYGASSDAYHITSPAPGGEGGARAMVNAIEDAKISKEDIDYINAHGTSTHLNDAFETAAIKTALGDASKSVLVSSTKGNTGHLLGAAGAIEAITCIKAIEDSFVPPTIGYKVPDEECDLDIVPNKGRNVEIKYAMSNSLGFGGHNSSVIIKKYEE